MAIDAHCHLTLNDYWESAAEMIEEGRRQGCHTFVLGGYDPGDWQRQLILKQLHPAAIVTCFGIHPWRVHQMDDDSLQTAFIQLEACLQSSDRSPALIGEVGLDRAVRYYQQSWDRQLVAFVRQLELGMRYQKPLILHVVKSHGIALEHLKAIRYPWSGIMHSFSGSADTAAQYRRLGFIPSISPMSIRTIDTIELAKFRLGEFIVESDGPREDIAHNEPPFIRRLISPSADLLNTAAAVAQLLNCTAEEVLVASEAAVCKILGR